jgi:hypothetical protein
MTDFLLIDNSYNHALTSLKTYILSRLLAHTEVGWTEVAIVTLVWMMVSIEPNPSTVDPQDLCHFFDDLLRNGKEAFTSEATHAILAVNARSKHEFPFLSDKPVALEAYRFQLWTRRPTKKHNMDSYCQACTHEQCW